ncbi:MAG TPA: hypothetical protein VJR89_00425, partial [Polyangiales bacterium]|nr:hypothetical protein [Polyangiales bacterium]
RGMGAALPAPARPASPVPALAASALELGLSPALPVLAPASCELSLPLQAAKSPNALNHATATPQRAAFHEPHMALESGTICLQTLSTARWPRRSRLGPLPPPYEQTDSQSREHPPRS